MLRNLRSALAAVGGAQSLIAIAAVAWGLGRLQSIAEERQAHIAQLDEWLAERLDLARTDAAGMHPSTAADPDAETQPEEQPA